MISLLDCTNVFLTRVKKPVERQPVFAGIAPLG